MVTLKDMWYFPGEVKEAKRIFQNFRNNENPEDIREEIVNATKKTPILTNLLKISKTYDMILRAEKNAEKCGWNNACQEAVKEMGVNYKIGGAENIPENGGTLYLSNHPYGLLDAAILIGDLGSLISKKEKKLKVIAMNQLRAIKGIEEVVIFVHSTVKKPNMGSVRESLRHIKNGGDLAIYPAGEMSGEGLREYPWKNLERFIKYSSCVVPMWFSGPNHAKIYNFLAKNKRTEKLRRIFSLREAWNKEGKTVILNIGKPITSESLEEKAKKENKEIMEYLRQTAEALKVDV